MNEPYVILTQPIQAKVDRLRQMLDDLDKYEMPADTKSNTPEQKALLRERAEIRFDIHYAGQLARSIATDIDSITHEERGYPATRELPV